MAPVLWWMVWVLLVLEIQPTVIEACCRTSRKSLCKWTMLELASPMSSHHGSSCCSERNATECFLLAQKFCKSHDVALKWDCNSWPDSTMFFEVLLLAQQCIVRSQTPQIFARKITRKGLVATSFLLASRAFGRPCCEAMKVEAIQTNWHRIGSVF